ncbi:MAG: TIGR01777 family oxidoreductase, partial [Bacteroidota bacterium]
MNILISGGTGFVGRHLVEALVEKGHQVAILTRQQKRSKDQRITYLQWDGESMPMGIGIYDAVINLAGAGIAESKWTPARKKILHDSRVLPTKALVNYINKSPRTPQVFLQISAVGFYGTYPPGTHTEDSPSGEGYLAELGIQWEKAAEGVKCRTVLMRLGVVLGDGGFLDRLLPVYRFYLGGKLGSGKQPLPWIHIDDVVKSMIFFLENEAMEGPVNMVAPELVDQKTFSKEFADVMDVADIWTIPKFA